MKSSGQENLDFSIKKKRTKRKVSKYEKDAFLDDIGNEKYYNKIKYLIKEF